MRKWLRGGGLCHSRIAILGAVGAGLTLIGAASAMAQSAPEAGGGEANLTLPDLSQVRFLGTDGHTLLSIGILFCIFGLLFGLTIYRRLKNLPVHRAMREVSELIYETCKTYLLTQGKFLLFLWVFIVVIIVLYFGVLAPVQGKPVLVTLPVILLFSPRDYAGPCFIGFAIGESLGAAALRIAGGIFTKIADIGSDLMKIV